MAFRLRLAALAILMAASAALIVPTHAAKPVEPDDGIIWSPHGPHIYGRMHHIPMRVDNIPDRGELWTT